MLFIVTKIKINKIDSRPINNIYADLRLLNEKDFSDILNLYKIIKEDLGSKDWIRFRTNEYLNMQIEMGGLILGCYANNQLIACGILEIPCTKETNLPYNLEVSQHTLSHTALLGFLMVHPSYRGNNLQIILVKERIKYAKVKGFKHIYTSIAQENIYSINNLEKLGFKITKKICDSNNTLKYVLYKQI